VHATFPAHLILLDLVTLIIFFCEEYKLWRPSVCSLPYALVTSSHVSPDTTVYTLFSSVGMSCVNPVQNNSCIIFCTFSYLRIQIRVWKSVLIKQLQVYRGQFYYCSRKCYIHLHRADIEACLHSSKTKCEYLNKHRHVTSRRKQ